MEGINRAVGVVNPQVLLDSTCWGGKITGQFAMLLMGGMTVMY